MESFTIGSSSSTFATAQSYWASFSIFVIVSLLNGGTIYTVIFAVSAYEADIHELRPELYNNHQSVIVALDIKDIVLVANIVNAVEAYA